MKPNDDEDDAKPVSLKSSPSFTTTQDDTDDNVKDAEDEAQTKMKASDIAPSVERPVSYIAVVGPNDVLMGRGVSLTGYKGNVRFRALVAKYQDKYANTTRRRDKDKLARKILGKLRKRQTKFLHKVETAAEEKALGIPNGETGYIEATESVVVEKIKQALRHREQSPDASRRASSNRGSETTTTEQATATVAVGESISSAAAAAMNQAGIPFVYNPSAPLTWQLAAALNAQHRPPTQLPRLSNPLLASTGIHPSTAAVLSLSTQVAQEQRELQQGIIQQQMHLQQLREQQLAVVREQQQQEMCELQFQYEQARQQQMFQTAMAAAAAVLPFGTNNAALSASAAATAAVAMAAAQSLGTTVPQPTVQPPLASSTPQQEARASATASFAPAALPFCSNTTALFASVAAAMAAQNWSLANSSEMPAGSLPVARTANGTDRTTGRTEPQRAVGPAQPLMLPPLGNAMSVPQPTPVATAVCLPSSSTGTNASMSQEKTSRGNKHQNGSAPASLRTSDTEQETTTTGWGPHLLFNAAAGVSAGLSSSSSSGRSASPTVHGQTTVQLLALQHTINQELLSRGITSHRGESRRSAPAENKRPPSSSSNSSSSDKNSCTGRSSPDDSEAGAHSSKNAESSCSSDSKHHDRHKRPKIHPNNLS